MNEDVELELNSTPVVSSPLPIPIEVSGPSRSPTPIPDSKAEVEENLISHIRSAATMLAQLNSKNLPRADAAAIRARILTEMATLEEQRLALAIPADDADTSIERAMVDKEDPSAAVFAEEWAIKRDRIRRGSVWGDLPGWDLSSVIVKSDAEMEEVGSQLIFGLKRIWEGDGIDVWVRRYFWRPE
jgi:phosphatidylinositol 4-kinase